MRPAATALFTALCFADLEGCARRADPPAVPQGRFEAVPREAPLRYPTRLALGLDDTLYVSDVEANEVAGFRDGKKTVQLTGLDRPLGLAVHQDLLYVGNRGRRSVEVYDLAAKTAVRTLGRGEGEFEMPNAVAVAPDGVVYVADSRADLVKWYGSDGRLLGQLGGSGSGDGQLRFPAAVAADDSRVVVGDQGNHRLAVFDRTGRWVRSLGGEAPESAASASDFAGRFTRIQGVALRGGLVYVLDSYHGHVQVLDEGGAPLRFLGQLGDCAGCTRLALDVAVGGAGEVLVSDPEHRRWVTYPGGAR